MKRTLLISMAQVSLLAVLANPARLAAQPPRYKITDLGTLPGGSFSQGSQGNTDNGLVAGVSTVADGSQHAVVWFKGRIMDIAKIGLGGPNSIAIDVNERGQAVGAAEIHSKDSENFCAFGSGFQCVPFLWENGVMTQLPTLGGPNGGVSTINNQGEAAGVAESSVIDATCIKPQQHRFEALTWGSKPGEIRELRPLPGDTVGFAFWMNDNGQVVGTSGLCGNTVPSGVVTGPHAVLWEKDGSVHDLGNLGGTVNTDLLAVGNRAIGINNQGQVVGGSSLPGSLSAHAFLWTRHAGMRDIGALPGDATSGALAINDRGEIVGVSNDKTGNPRAFLWRNDRMSDLNDLVVGESPLYLLFAAGIDNRGDIAGFGVTATGDIHAFLATRAPTTASAGPKNSTVIARQVTLDGTASFSVDDEPLTYQWSIPQGNPQAAILHGNTANPEVQFASGRNAYTFQLTVTDAAGATATDLVTVNFQGN